MPLDRFSGHADLYAQYRIDYPEALYTFVLSKVGSRPAVRRAAVRRAAVRRAAVRQTAWDCATGNGQVAAVLADHFERVEATDISQTQLDQAVRKPNITYRVSPAEQTPFADASFDLVTVGQALHWFDVDAFHAEVRRVLKPGGVIAEWGYGLNTISPEVDVLVRHFYSGVVGPFWDAMRRHVENEYADLSFPFAGVEKRHFEVIRHWDAERFLNYLRTWSAVRKYIQANGADPVDALAEKLIPVWGEGERTVRFPVFLRLGRL